MVEPNNKKDNLKDNNNSKISNNMKDLINLSNNFPKMSETNILNFKNDPLQNQMTNNLNINKPFNINLNKSQIVNQNKINNRKKHKHKNKKHMH